MSKENSDGQQANCPDESRRTFLKTTTLVGGAVAIGSVASPFVSRAEAQELTPRQVPLSGMNAMPGKANHWYVPASDKTG
jgi:hypothetical protein